MIIVEEQGSLIIGALIITPRTYPRKKRRREAFAKCETESFFSFSDFRFLLRFAVGRTRVGQAHRLRVISSRTKLPWLNPSRTSRSRCRPSQVFRVFSGKMTKNEWILRTVDGIRDGVRRGRAPDKRTWMVYFYSIGRVSLRFFIYFTKYNSGRNFPLIHKDQKCHNFNKCFDNDSSSFNSTSIRLRWKVIILKYQNQIAILYYSTLSLSRKLYSLDHQFHPQV